MPTRTYKAVITEPGATAAGTLAAISSLSLSRIKDAMNKGAVWLHRGKSARRLRRSKTALRAGDELRFYYDPDILALQAPPPVLIADEKHYSVWAKPAGLLAQGTREGDHCALLRIAEQELGRDVYLVHRLDREAAGLMLIAHTGKAAAALSALFADRGGRMQKIYRVEVKGLLPAQGEFASPLDGKSALTRYRLLKLDETRECSLAEVELVSGRKHQIRRHFAEAGFPVLGDPLYGAHNKDERGLQLTAVQLGFLCPLTGKKRDYRL